MGDDHQYHQSTSGAFYSQHGMDDQKPSENFYAVYRSFEDLALKKIWADATSWYNIYRI